MKVLHIGKYFEPYRGGIETYLREISTALHSRLWLKVLVCNHLPYTIHEHYNGISLTRAASYGRLFSLPISPSFIIEAAEIISSFHPDIVHIHLPNPLSDVIANGLMHRREPKLIVHWHSDIVRQRLIRKALSPLLLATLERANAILVPTENHIHASEVLIPYREKISVAPLCLSQHTLPMDSNAKREEIKTRAKSRPVVLCVGRLVYYKGISYLIDAITSLDVLLIIVGNGPLRAHLERQVKANALEEKVWFAGEVEHITPFLKEATCLALPSTEKSEGFGVVLLEAMREKRPLITTTLGTGIDLANRNGITGFAVEPKSSEALCRAITRLIEDKTLAKQMGHNAYDHFLKYYTTEAAAEQLLGLYSSLIKQ